MMYSNNFQLPSAAGYILRGYNAFFKYQKVNYPEHFNIKLEKIFELFLEIELKMQFLAQINNV